MKRVIFWELIPVPVKATTHHQFRVCPQPHQAGWPQGQQVSGQRQLPAALLSPQPAPVGEHLLWGLSALCASTPCRPADPTAKHCCDVPMGDCCLKVIPRGTSWHHSSSSWGTLLQGVLLLPSVVRWWITVIIKKKKITSHAPLKALKVFFFFSSPLSTFELK